jgi:protein NDRG1
MSDDKKADDGGAAEDAPPVEAPPPKPEQRADGLSHHVVPTERCGALNVYVEGDLNTAYKDKDSKCVFLCVHDVGLNHESIKKFMDHDSFDEIKRRTVIVYVDIPGHESGAADIAESKFPTIQEIGEDLVTVLDQLRIRYVIGLGDGAGANIMARFGMMHVTRCMGVILLHPTSNKDSMTATFMTKFKKIKPSAENLAVFRKFGHKLDNVVDEEGALDAFASQLGKDLNRKNMKLYLDAYAKRRDITSHLASNLKCDALIVVGSKTSHVLAAEHMHTNMDKTRSSFLKIDDVGYVLEEAPCKLSNCILLFIKGLGWLTSINLPGVERRRSVDDQGNAIRQRSISMEDYDKPNIRRLSISSGSKD